MKKLFIGLIIFLLSITSVFAFDIDPVEKKVIVPKGSFLKVVSQKQISTEFLDEGQGVTFISFIDTYADMYKIIPEKSIYYGYVEKINEPIQGTNASMKIKINKIITPEGKHILVNGYVVTKTNSNDLVGGEQTNPCLYQKMPHKSQGWKGIIQYAPVNVFDFGQHTIIKSGEEVMIVLKDDLILFFEEDE